MADDQRFVTLAAGKRIWFVSAIHGDYQKLCTLHRLIGQSFNPGESLIYSGNFLGHGKDVAKVIDELLYFRRLVIMQPGACASDVVFLRGGQEEMLQKLLQIHFARKPDSVLEWMGRHGVDATLRAYDTSIDEALSASAEGMSALVKWSTRLNNAIRQRDGHRSLMSALRRAAIAAKRKLLFVNANIDPERPLDAQSDDFWWGSHDYRSHDVPFDGFDRVVRGYDPRHRPIYMANHHLCLDGGCGFGGKLIAAAFDSHGSLVERLEV